MSIELIIAGIIGVVIAFWVAKKLIKVVLFLAVAAAVIYFLGPTIAGSLF